MKYGLPLKVGAALVLANLVCACDQVGMGNQAPVSDGAPSDQDLQKIGYMSTDPGPKGRKLYGHYEQAKTCGDFELASRWNRPPNIEGGPFHTKMLYLKDGIPADLKKNSEVFLTGIIDKGETMPSGSAGWLLKMPDGSIVQAIESSNFWEKEEQASQQTGTAIPIIRPEKSGRALCIQGVYEGVEGKTEDPNKKLPLVSVMFAMDRDK
jgi:hypothetical protein